MKKWKVLKSERAFDHKWFKVQRDSVELANGKVLDDYFYYLHGDVSMIIPITPKQEIVMERIYRKGTDEIMLELPSGMIDENEDPSQAAKRELEEETGYTGSNFEFLGKFVSMPGKVVSNFYLYLIKDVKQSKSGQSLEETEDIEVVLLPIKEVLEKIKSGEINNAYMITGIYFTCQKLGIPIS